MPKFFFHVIDGEFYPDTTGQECASDDAAKAHAVRITGEMVKDQGLQLWRTGRYDMYVCDEQNRTRLCLSFHAEGLRD